MNSSRSLRKLALLVLLAVIYLIAGKLGLRLAFVNPSATAVWPPAGIALAALLVLGYQVWPGVFFGAFLVNITTAGSVATSVGIAMGNTLEALAGCYLVNRFGPRPQSFQSGAAVSHAVRSTPALSLSYTPKWGPSGPARAGWG
jgi:integral membrane sensor domain MASE1